MPHPGNATLIEIGRIYSENDGQKLDEAIEAYRKSKKSEAVEAVLVFIRGEPFEKYNQALGALKDGERSEVIKLITDASQRTSEKLNRTK